MPEALEMLHVFRRAALAVAGLADPVAVAVEDERRGEAPDAVLLRQLFVFSFRVV